MGWKRILTVLVSVCVTPGLGTIALAADGDNGDTETKKSKFAIFVEAAGGSAAADLLNASINTTTTDLSNATLDLDSNLFGRAAVGWQLTPKERGKFLFRFEGYREDSYKFDAQGMQAAAIGASSGDVDPLVWWTVHAEAGGTTSVKTTPIYDSRNDEVFYDDILIPNLEIHSPAPSDLQNRTQTFDLYYERRFGGRRTRALWTAGLRYYTYEGNVPAGAWLNLDFNGVGFTDGGVLRLMTLNQSASGIGPVFSIELQHGFLRDRLVIYGEARSAFVLQDIEVDSGQFFTLVRDRPSAAFITAPARLNDSTSKSSWQPGLEIGLAVKLVEGLQLYLSYLINSYQDVVLLPNKIIIPENPGQAIQGVSGVYNTHDLYYEGGLFGVSYQW
jgi:hypothetical protein